MKRVADFTGSPQPIIPGQVLIPARFFTNIAEGKAPFNFRPENSETSFANHDFEFDIFSPWRSSFQMAAEMPRRAAEIFDTTVRSASQQFERQGYPPFFVRGFVEVNIDNPIRESQKSAMLLPDIPGLGLFNPATFTREEISSMLMNLPNATRNAVTEAASQPGFFQFVPIENPKRIKEPEEDAESTSPEKRRLNPEASQQPTLLQGLTQPVRQTIMQGVASTILDEETSVHPIQAVQPVIQFIRQPFGDNPPPVIKRVRNLLKDVSADSVEHPIITPVAASSPTKSEDPVEDDYEVEPVWTPRDFFD